VQRGFTLIEVIIAVAILSIAAMAVFNLGLQGSRISGALSDRQALLGPLSIAALNGSADHHNMTRTLDRLIESEYEIDHDRLRRYLGQASITYHQRTLKRIDPIGMGEESGLDLPRFELIERQVSREGKGSLRIIGVRVEP
jgi:prepilin-type N-terminal cleavage/methylation domain-containing protein